jgi:DNA-binding GntR family transcriptional regulator
MSKALVDENDFVLIQLDIQFHDALYRSEHHERLWNSWSSIRSQVLLSLLTKRHASNEYYRASRHWCDDQWNFELCGDESFRHR